MDYLYGKTERADRYQENCQKKKEMGGKDLEKFNGGGWWQGFIWRNPKLS